MSIGDFFNSPWLDVAKSVIASASLIAAITPNHYDNTALKFLRGLVDVLAFNFGNAKNASKR